MNQARRLLRQHKVAQWMSVANILTLLWIYIVYASERSVFRSSIDRCHWRHWESWPPNSQPHHVLLVADPQLVDPHTYPGRPWPLSTLTIRYTDLYLRRVYRLLQKNLYPDTTIFLGDLFDGGREWSTWESTSPEERWRGYGEHFWIKEYKRFSAIFFDSWTTTGIAGRIGQPPRRKIVASIPGNHDLGFAAGIQKPVRNRFNAYFGEGNRIDIFGNHTFVSIDTVSLSAKGLPEGSDEAIWRPASDFLDDAAAAIRRATVSHLKLPKGEHGTPLYDHITIESNDLAASRLPHPNTAELGSFPSILLTHVPMFRDPGTPCGPQREHWPLGRSADGSFLDVDERNAISVSGGYQYQNVLTLDISKDIASKIGDLSYAFSGDDHDYCEVVHRRYPSAGGGIREITVKSISWAMGVRKPGVVLLSLWNPVDDQANPLPAGSKDTLQSQLCLLPDQLGLFIDYAMLFAITLCLLSLRAGHLALNPSKSYFGRQDAPLLPTTTRSSPEPSIGKGHSSSSDDGLTQIPYDVGRGQLSARVALARSRNSSPRPSTGYGLPSPGTASSVPLVANASHYPSRDPKSKEEKLSSILGGSGPKRPSLRGLALFNAELTLSILRVALVVVPWYLWLIWSG